MKTGRCVRCQCVKNGLPCVDCWPSVSNPSRCENLAATSQSSTIVVNSPGVDTDVRSGDLRPPDCQIPEFVAHVTKPTRILKRIPRLSRPSAARKLAAIIELAVSHNDIPSWTRLLQFPKRCFCIPQRGGKRWNLVSLINKQVSEEGNNFDGPLHNAWRQGNKSDKSSKSWNSLEVLAARVSSKLEEGDYKGAVRLACSKDRIADHSASTFAALKLKHPPRHIHSIIEDPPHQTPWAYSINADEIRKFIMSFPNGSSGGIDGLSPQHLKDLIGPAAEEGATNLLNALTALITLILEGRTPASIRPLFFGAQLRHSQRKMVMCAQ